MENRKTVQLSKCGGTEGSGKEFCRCFLNSEFKAKAGRILQESIHKHILE